MAQQVKNPPAMQETLETWVWSLGQEDPMEKEMATHCRILAWKTSWTGEPGRLQCMGLQRADQAYTTILVTDVGWRKSPRILTSLTSIQWLNISLHCFPFSFPVISFHVFYHEIWEMNPGNPINQFNNFFLEAPVFVYVAEATGQLPCQTHFWVENTADINFLICNLTTSFEASSRVWISCHT